MASEIAATKRGLFSRETHWSDNALLIGLALIVLVGHLLTNAQYGYQRDEFYYQTCGRHLAWGYVDHPPLTPVLSTLSIWLFGSSLWALRFFPTVAGALLVIVTGLITRELGGNRFAQTVAAISTMMVPLFIAANGLLMPISIDILAWTFSSYLVLRIIKYKDARLWPVVGLTIGIGILNKYNMLFYATALLVGLTVCGHKRMFKSGWFWTGSLVAFLVVLPNLIWQIQHNWATLEFLHNLNRNVMARISRPMFLFLQVLFMNPLGLPLWFAGLYFYLCMEEGRPYRVFALIFLLILAFLLIANGKPYYLGAAYPVLFSAAPIAIMRLARRWQWRWDRVRTLYAGLLTLGMAVGMIAILPILPAESGLRYELGKKWSSYAEILGWDELVAQVADIYKNRLTAAEQSEAAILTENYGEAGAVDVLGEQYGLPRAISGHNNYYLWGPSGYSGKVCIVIGLPQKTVEAMFADVALVGRVSNSQGIINQEYGRPIYLCRSPRKNLAEMWPSLRHFD